MEVAVVAAAPRTAIVARVAQLPSSTKRQPTLAAIVVSAAAERDRAVHPTDSMYLRTRRTTIRIDRSPPSTSCGTSAQFCGVAVYTPAVGSCRATGCPAGSCCSSYGLYAHPPLDIRLACTPPFFLSLSTVVEAQLPIAVLSAMVTAVIQPAVAASVAHDMASE